jgi:hypothetical protein
VAARRRGEPLPYPALPEPSKVAVLHPLPRRPARKPLEEAQHLAQGSPLHPELPAEEAQRHRQTQARLSRRRAKTASTSTFGPQPPMLQSGDP